jgi:hypothetical protein
VAPGATQYEANQNPPIAGFVASGVGHVEEVTSEKKRLRPLLMPLLLSNNFFIAFLLKPNSCAAP